MSLSPILKPNKRVGIRTTLNFRTTVRSEVRRNLTGPILLFVLPAAATLTIWTTDPLADLLYECCIFLLAGWAVATTRETPSRAAGGRCQALVAAGIALWGFAQTFTGATVYRYATFEQSLRYAALAASALAAYLLLRSPAVRERFLRAWVWFAAAVALTGVAAYYTLPGQVLWLLPSPYPDVWGPFLSRNNFAQFLELALPVALYLAFDARTAGARWAYGIAGGIVLAAGYASASRAGAVLLTAEVLAVAALGGRSWHSCTPRAWSWKPLAATSVVAALILWLSGGTLAGRLSERDPLGLRREIFQSSAEMIAARPWQGYGLGTFREVYPQFARFDAGRTVEHAHSDWLEWAAEGGTGFALLWLAGFLRTLPRAWRTVWGLGVPGLFLHALGDDPFARTGVAAWAFILAGAMETTRQARNSNPQS
jgi:O-antigen ligase